MRKLMWFSLGFTGACAIGAFCYVPWLWGVAVLFALLAALFLTLKRWHRPLRIAGAVFVGAAVGMLWFSCFNVLFLSTARNYDGQSRWLSIRAADYSYATNYGSAVDGEVILEGRTYRVRTYLNRNYKLEPGDKVRGQFRFRVTTGSEGSEPTYHSGNGVFLLAYQDGNCAPQRYWHQEFRDLPAIWRNSLLKLINKSFPQDTEGFARALLLGDSSGFDYETNTNFKESGISHIIAVSGMHVSLLFSLVYLLMGHRRTLTAIIGIPVLILFAAVAGFTPSITRACIMQIVFIIAMLVDKEYDPMTSLSVAALTMLTVNPLVITSVSFQLSAGCMSGIFLFGEPIRRWMLAENRLGRWKGWFVNWFTSSTAVTLAATVFVTPLTAFHFGSVSLIGVLTNLLTLWVTTYIFYGVIIACVLGSFSTAAGAVVGVIVAWPIRYVLSAAEVMASVPLACLYTRSIYVVAWLILTYLLLAVYLFAKQKPALIFAGMVAGGLVVAVAFSWTEPILSRCRMTMLDVGQGQAILLQSQGKTFLVDCGGDSGQDAADVTAETLLSQGIRKLDGIILTHYDADHAGGLEYLLTRIKTDALYLPYAEDGDVSAQTLDRLTDGQSYLIKEDTLLQYGSVNITVFAPVSYESDNESSMCILFQAGNCDILITGDRGMITEQVLLDSYDLPQLEVLVAGHHGSRHSTSQELLQATQPEYVFISVGEENRYGHPSQEVLDRLEEFGCMVLRTDENGTIVFAR